MQCGKKIFISWVLPHGSSKVLSSHVGAAQSWASSESVDHFGQWSKTGLLPSPKPYEMTGLEHLWCQLPAAEILWWKKRTGTRGAIICYSYQHPWRNKGSGFSYRFPQSCFSKFKTRCAHRWPRCAYRMGPPIPEIWVNCLRPTPLMWLVLAVLEKSVFWNAWK